MISHISITYYYYYHLNPDFPKEEIKKAINSHDYTTFMKFYNQWKNDDLYYLPDVAFIYDEIDDKGGYLNILDEQNFNLITDCEYECG